MQILLQKGPLVIRRAEKSDVSAITKLIQALALYEKAPEQCFATDELIESSVFDRGEAQVLMAEYGGEVAGMALYFYNYSTWKARKGLYLEDLFVYPGMRGKGIGKTLILTLGKMAAAEGCGRFEWCCLDWNTPSINFYKSLGAKPMDEWTIYRLEGEALQKLAEEGE